MRSSLHLQQCPACLVRVILIVFMIGGWWAYSCCFVGSCIDDLFYLTRSILVQLPSSFFSIRLVSVHVVDRYSCIDTTTAWKKLHFILWVRSDFHMSNSLSRAGHTFVSHVSVSRLMRHCFLGRWTCQLVSESYCFVWRCHLFHSSTYIPFRLRWHGYPIYQPLRSGRIWHKVNF